jgi:MFS family permease
VARLTGTLVLSNAADQFALIAVLWFLLDKTGSPVLLGVAVLCGALPALATAPLAGMLVDRRDPARLVALDNLARAACLAALPVAAWCGVLSVPLLLVAVGLAGALAPLTYAGTRVLLPRLVPAADLPAANGVLGLGDQIPFLLGPATAGVLVAHLGGPTALLFPAAALVAAALLANGVAPVERADAGRFVRVEREAVGGGRRVLRGVGVLWRVRPVRALMVLTLAYYLAYGPVETALPVFVRGQLHAGASAYGALWGVFGAGAVVGLVLVRPLSRWRPGVVNALGAVAWGLAVAPMALARSVPVAMALFVLGAVVWAPYSAIEMSVLQRLVPADRLGTVLGTRRALLVGASPTGAALGSLLVAPGTAGLVIAGSAAACALVGLACLAYPALRAVLPPQPTTEPATAPTSQVGGVTDRDAH